MSMTLVNAKTYVARIIGGANDSKALDLAGEAISRAYTDWSNQKFWTFLLRDTSSTTAVTGVTATAASAAVNAPSVGAFDFVNVGQTVTISTGTATLAADTTVSSFIRGSDGVITSITLSASFGGTTNSSATLTFSADIPLYAGNDEYNLPSDFNGAYTARLIDAASAKQPLNFIDLRLWDKNTLDQSLRGIPESYTTYNPISEGTQNFGTSRLKVFKVPDAAHTLRLRYFRVFNQTGTYIDVPDQYLYQFLDYARMLMLATKRAQDDPNSYAQEIQAAFGVSQQTDEQPNDDDDGDSRMKSMYETGSRGPLVNNGDFDVYPL